MSDEVKKPVNIHSQMLKVKPSCHFSGKVQKVKERLTEYRFDVTHKLVSCLQASMNLEQTFQDALSEYDVEVVSVSEDIEGTFDYMKRKNNTNANVIACVRMDVETGDRNLRITRKNDHLLERSYPCEILFDIQEAGDTSQEYHAQKFSEFQPFTITKHRSYIINAWLENYQQALGDVVAARKGTKKIKLQNSEVMGFEFFPEENIGETILWIINKVWINIKSLRQELQQIIELYDCELYDSIIKLIIRRCIKTDLRRKYVDVFNGLWPIFQPKDEEMEEADRNFTHALEEEIKIIQNQRLPIPDHSGMQRGQWCQLTSFCCGLVDPKNCSMGFGFRAESFDRIHVTSSRFIDACIDKKTVREATHETQTVDEYILEKNLKMSRKDRKRLFKLVNKYSEELMEKHSNLNRISVSPVLSHKHGRIEETPCIVMYCSCKGIRPPDEPEFQKQMEGVPVDVREGYCSLFGVSDAKDYNDPLRTGISIGGHEMNDFGTLGPFVVEAENKTSVGFLTCQHVFPSAAIDRDVVQPSVRHYKADTNLDTTICGKIRSMYIGDVLYNGKMTSVDVAYVTLNKRIPKDFKFPDIPESMTDLRGNLKMGQPIMQLEEDDDEIHIYKLGQTSGLTKGSFDTMRAIAVLGKEKVRNLYQVSSDILFAEPGDSGSIVFTVNGNTLSVIGLLLGGSDNYKECYVIPIGAVLQALQPRVEIHQFKDGTTTDVEGSNNDHQSDGASVSPSAAQSGCVHSQSARVEYPELSKSVNTFSRKK